jgi:hypothetical protein
MAAGFGLASFAFTTPARADITLYDQDGWSFYTKGMVASHLNLTVGDADPLPSSGKVLVGGQLLPVGAEDRRDQSIVLSRVRGGFVGTQFGLGAGREINDQVRIKSLIAVSLNDVSSNRGTNVPKGVDWREAWAGVEGPLGTFKFGRMFSIFGSASGEVVMMAYRYAVGHPCLAGAPTPPSGIPPISCGSVGAGPLFAGFDAQLRYITPRLAGFEFQAAVSDPLIAPDFKITPTPRFDADLNWEAKLSANSKLRFIGQGMTQEVRRVQTTPTGSALQNKKGWGGMGAGLFHLGGFSVGGGGGSGKGGGARGGGVA